MIKFFRIPIVLLSLLPLPIFGQHVGINIDTPTVDLDIRSLDANQASQINLGNLDNSHLLRLFSGSETEPAAIIFWNEGHPLILGNGTAGVEFFERLQIAADGRVGIGTSPDSSALLQVESTTKGILFPRMTTEQRDAIVNPVNGLHVFNTESQCLEYFDDYINEWNCYCLECRTKVITIISNVCGIDFFTTYANSLPVPQKYILIIPDTVLISSCSTGQNAIDFSGLPAGSEVVIKNYGSIVGGGGNGGNGGTGNHCYGASNVEEENGMNGGHAIVSAGGIIIHVENYGIVAGGGGGGAGGGGSGTCSDFFGGGGGGGAGHPAGGGGYGHYDYIGIYDFCSCFFHESDFGSSGSQVNDLNSPDFGGNGGNGVIFTGDCDNDGSEIGAVGGIGGPLGSAGQQGTQCTGVSAVGGNPGKAISGGNDNTIVNLGSGVIYGVVD